LKLMTLALPLLLLFAEGEEPPTCSALLEEVAVAHAAGDLEVATAALDTLLGESLDLREWQRAEVQYAHGVLLSARHEAPPDPLTPPPDILEAAPPFDSARALAGPTALRLDATYNLGVVFLLEGERLRKTIPELAQQTGPRSANVPVPAPAPALPPGSDPSSDPLQRARTAYDTAKEHLIERLKADWRDEDTRANLELIQRRLHELDQIEKQREEQQQEQDQEQQDEEGEEGEGEEGEDQESGEESEGEDSEEEDPSESDSEGDPENQKPEGGPPREQETQETEPPEEGGEAQQADPGELQERLLTREEVMRLLDRLSKLEEERELLDAALRESQRVPVPRDW